MLLSLWSAKIIRCTDEEIRWSGVARAWTYENLFLWMDEMLRWRGTTSRWSGKSWSPQILQRLEIKTSCLVSGPFVDGGKYQLVKM